MPSHLPTKRRSLVCDEQSQQFVFEMANIFSTLFFWLQIWIKIMQPYQIFALYKCTVGANADVQ